MGILLVLFLREVWFVCLAVFASVVIVVWHGVLVVGVACVVGSISGWDDYWFLVWDIIEKKWKMVYKRVLSILFGDSNNTMRSR